MFDQRVLLPDQFPVSQTNRKSTDVCCTIIGALFALTMFILACVFWNQGNYDKLSSLTDSKGNVCAAFLNFPNINDLSIRQCVAVCPADYTVAESSSGKTCLPKSQTARNKLLESPSVSYPWDKTQYKNTIFYSCLIALGVGLIWMTIVHCFPRIAPIIAFVLSSLLLIAIGVLLLLDNSGFWKSGSVLKIIVAVVCFILAIIVIVMLCSYSSQVKFQGIFLEYSVKFLTQNPLSFVYIPIFLLFTLGLFALIIWQGISFAMKFGNSTRLSKGGVLGVLNILQFIWGMQFLRDAFNFCVSGAAVDWYWLKNTSCYTPYSRLVCKHWGSVVGGSFLNAFFEIPTLIVELFICHPQTCCAKMGTMCYNSCTCCSCFFDLVRTDAYSYINLSGIPFCDAARQCKRRCDQSHQFIGTHSAMKHYRFAAHVLCVSAAFLASYFVLRYRVFNYTAWQLGILIVVIYACVTFFIGIHADAAEGLQTSFLVEHSLQKDYPYMQKCLPSLRKQLQHLDTRKKVDGTC